MGTPEAQLFYQLVKRIVLVVECFEPLVMHSGDEFLHCITGGDFLT